METQPCRRCYEHKPLAEFPPPKPGKKGRRRACLACQDLRRLRRNQKARHRYRGDPEAQRARTREAAAENPSKAKQYREANREKRKVYAAEYYRKNRKACLARARRYREEGGLDGHSADGLPVRPGKPGRRPRSFLSPLT